MRVLLDTHVFLWWITDDRRVSARARDVLSSARNVLFFSAASGWEIAIKAGLGRIELPSPLERFLTLQLRENCIQVLPIQLSHALRVHALPLRHRDPFDRMLVAQAQLEKLPILSADARIAEYGVESFW